MFQPLLVAVLLLAGCGAPSPYVRVTTEDGRLYYANMDRALHTETGGFLAFKDLVTREPIRLKNGSYLAQRCPPGEVEMQQRAYLDDPSKPPHVSDFAGEQK